MNDWSGSFRMQTAYLETGSLPWDSPKWPLPPTKLDRPERGKYSHFPLFRELIELAIYEKKPDQVIRWYDQWAKQARGGYGGDEDRVAEAVKKDYPDRAVAIWKKIAEGELRQDHARKSSLMGILDTLEGKPNLKP